MQQAKNLDNHIFKKLKLFSEPELQEEILNYFTLNIINGN
jgi:hypothetical protein